MTPDPSEFGWWLASRAAGVVALVCITLSVGIGLAMAGRVSRRPDLARKLLSLHQQTALVGLVAIAVHAITLLGDKFLSPSLGDIAIPFTSQHEPLWTGLGVTGGWLAVILGLSYWIRDRMRAGLWRKLHRATVLVYVLSVTHALGAGTDASEPWMRALLVTSGAPILFLFLMRVLTPAAGPRFRRFRVADVRPESNSVLSLHLVPADRKGTPTHEPGQFVPVRLQLQGDKRVVRSYSLSCAAHESGCRISVKRETGGRVSEHLHTAVEVGDTIELSSPAGTFILGAPSAAPLVLVSAGIGVTPVLAMLEALGRQHSQRTIWWIHSARNGAEHPFRSEAKAHLAYLTNGHCHVRYTQPRPSDQLHRDYDAAGRLSATDILQLGVPTHAEFRLCGPTGFVADLTAGVLEAGVDRARVQSESFGGAHAPRVAGPALAVGDGPTVQFFRSGITAVYGSHHSNLLEVAEAYAIPVASGCRIGACHGCRADIIAGSVLHNPEPVETPPAGSALLCCAIPEGDVVLGA